VVIDESPPQEIVNGITTGLANPPESSEGFAKRLLESKKRNHNKALNTNRF
jgi:hypothetical protein